MLQQTSEEFRERFLQEFIKALLRNTEAYKKAMEREGLIISQEIKEKLAEPIPRVPEKKQIKEIVKEKIHGEKKKVLEMGGVGLPRELETLERPKVMIQPPREIYHGPLRIPEQRLPPTLSYLRPIPTNKEIDLGNLNVLVRDPLVKVIECNGSGSNIVVMGIMGRKNTPIKLTKEDIDRVISAFSKASRIPINQGLFKAAVGRLVMSAVVSEEVGTRFIIRKIAVEI